MLKMLSKADNAIEVTGMMKLFSHTKMQRFLNVAKGMSTIGFLDLAFMGFDVFQLRESLNEADIVAKVNELRAHNKRHQARFHMGTAVSSFLIEAGIVWACAYGGGTI
jgi:hypothetical protein